jgi:hypothetical protein
MNYFHLHLKNLHNVSKTTTIKTLSYLLTAAFAVLVWGCDNASDKNNNNDKSALLSQTKTEATPDSSEFITDEGMDYSVKLTDISCPPWGIQLKLANDKWHISMSKDLQNIAKIDLINCESGQECSIPLATYPNIAFTFNKNTRNLVISQYEEPVFGVQSQPLPMPATYPVYFDIIYNSHRFPSGNVFKIIGTDDDRESLTTLKYAIGNFENDNTVYLRWDPNATGGARYFLRSTNATLSTKTETGNVDKALMQADGQATECP